VPSRQLTIGYITKSATNQGFIITNTGASDQAKADGVNLLTVGPAQAQSLEGQLAAIEDMISRKVDAIMIAPVDSAGVAPAVKKAMDAHIPVIAVDTAVTGADVTSFVATDNLKAATMQGTWAAQNVPDNGEVILINGPTAQSTGKDRHDGFVSALKAAKPNVTIYEVQTNWDQTQAQNGAEDLLRAHPGVSLIACAWDAASLGSVAALKDLGKTAGQVKVLGLDGAPDALKLMEQGWVQADVAQMLYQEGSVGLKTAEAAANGQTVNVRIDTGTTMVTPDNVVQFAKDNKLDQFMQ
jgi:ribose transport system substrate-binding protein